MSTTCYSADSLLTPSTVLYPILEAYLALMVVVSLARLYISNRQLKKYKLRTMDMYVSEFFEQEEFESAQEYN